MEMHAKLELVNLLRDRYRLARKKDKSKILDEFFAFTGHHRKYALRMLAVPKEGMSPPFEGDWTTILQWLELQPDATASSMLERLIARSPEKYNERRMHKLAASNCLLRYAGNC